MICVICRQAETLKGRTFVTFERGEFRLLVSRVPARVCPNCGESYVEDVVAEQLLQIARQRFDLGILDAHCEYSAF